MHAAAQEHARRTERVTSGRQRAQYTPPLVRHLTEVIRPSDGTGPLLVIARMPAEDLSFFGYARDEIITLAGAVESVLNLHCPGFADGADGLPALGCRTCHVSWPCATISALDNTLTYGDGQRTWPTIIP